MKRLLTASFLAIFTAPHLYAQPAPPKLSAPPATVQRGQAVEISLPGGELSGVSRVDISNAAGLAAELVSADVAGVKVKLTLDPQATLGPRELRVVGPGGPSNPVTIHVGQYPTAQDKEPNDADQPPQEVSLPAMLIGAIDRPGDSDVYRFTAVKGQRLIAEARAAREGSVLDSVLALHNAAGREVANNNDAFSTDSFIVYEVPADGQYTLTVRDLKFRGGPAFGYRIAAGPIPYVKAIFPVAGQRGQSVEVEPIGYNLDTPKVSLNLADAGASVEVRAGSAGTPSNSKPFDVVTHPTATDAEPNNTPDKAQPVTPPAVISGRIEKPGDVDVYAFKVEQPMKIAAEALAARYGSPVDPLLTLRDAAGNVVMRNDDAAGFDARLVADLQPGQYTVAVQDLLNGGSPSHVYRLSIAPDAPPTQDFAVRFQPDAVRLPRGGHARVWCEVVRINGYAPDVEVAFEGLPEGVTIDPAPVNIGQSTSGVFTLAAAPEAKPGTFPIRLVATGTLGDGDAKRTGQPQIGNAVVQQGYVTVFDPAPFNVRPVDLTPQQIDAYAAELDSIEKHLTTPSPELHAAAGEWEKSLGQGQPWIALDTVEAKAAQGTTLSAQPDGSLKAVGANPATDTYTITTQTDLKGVTAVKVEVFGDESFPAKGPGRANNGNFVLSTISLQATSAADAAQTAAVPFASAFADFFQIGLPPDKSFDADNMLGWAVGGGIGVDHFAAFVPQQPIAGFDGGTRLTFTLLQNFGGNHTIGRLRLSATTAAEPKVGPTLPRPIAAVVAVPADQRTAEQKDALTRYYMSFAPQLQPDRNRAALLRSIVGPAREVAQLEAQLDAGNPVVDAAQAEWEKAVAGSTAPALSPWHLAGPFGAANMNAAFNNEFGPEKEKDFDPARTYRNNQIKWVSHPEWADGVVYNPFANPNAAFYLYRAIHSAVARPLELSLGSDDGIKLFVNGVEVLAKNVGRAAAPDQEKVTINLQAGENRLLMKIVNGIGAGGFYFKPAEGLALPQDVLAILKAPADQRTAEQTAALRGYYRKTIDPTLKPINDRLAALRSQVGTSFPPDVKRKQMIALSVALLPVEGYTGPVTVSLEGFSAGRVPATGLPVPITAHIDTAPVTLSASNSLGILSLTPKDASELGTRMVVLKAEGKVGDVPWVQYSPAFPLTVRE